MAIDLDRLTASLLAGALGDALGYAVEFDSYNAIRARYGERGITFLEREDGFARFSDDTQMTLFTAEGLAEALERGGDIADCVYRAYLRWLTTQGYGGVPADAAGLLAVPELHRLRAPGNTCLSALHSGVMGTIGDPINNSKGCGGVMRTAPLGALEPEDALLYGARAAAITHGHPMGYIPAGMLSYIVSLCLRGASKPLKQVVTDALARTRAVFAEMPGIDAFAALIERAVSLAESADAPDEASIRALGEGWVGDEALAIAVWAALRYPDDLTACLIAAVNHNGDSDSTGAIAGNILGAYLGEESLPKDWLDALECVPVIRDAAKRLWKSAN